MKSTTLPNFSIQMFIMLSIQVILGLVICMQGFWDWKSFLYGEASLLHLDVISMLYYLPVKSIFFISSSIIVTKNNGRMIDYK